MKQVTLKNYTDLLPYNTIIFNKNHACDYVGKKYAVLNGIYPLYNHLKNIVYWHYTTNTNSTGSSLENGLPILRLLSDINKAVLDLYPEGYLDRTWYESILRVEDGKLSWFKLSERLVEEHDQTIGKLRMIHVDTDDLLKNDNAINYETLSDDDKKVWQVELVKASNYKTEEL